MKCRLWSGVIVPMLAPMLAPMLTGALMGALAVPAPALAQFTSSYKFLQAVRDKDSQTVLDALGESGVNIVNTRDSSSGHTALHIVTARRDKEWMEFLLAKGADVNARDGHGETPLVIASNLSFVEGVDLLLRHGARVDEPSSTGETPLISAVHRRDLAMMRVLLAGGANPDRADNSGRSARDYAMLGGKNNTVITLIESASQNQGDHGAGTYGPKL